MWCWVYLLHARALSVVATETAGSGDENCWRCGEPPPVGQSFVLVAKRVGFWGVIFLAFWPASPPVYDCCVAIVVRRWTPTGTLATPWAIRRMNRDNANLRWRGHSYLKLPGYFMYLFICPKNPVRKVTNWYGCCMLQYRKQRGYFVVPYIVYVSQTGKSTWTMYMFFFVVYVWLWYDSWCR